MIINQVRKSLKTRNRLALENFISHRTVERWIQRNSIKLRTAMNLRIIAEELKVSIEDVLKSLEGRENGNTPSA